MREIKFRAWDSENKKYIYNPMEYELECIARIKGRDDWKYESFIGFSPMEFEIFVIEQFTGLHDKNGKEIYEGDVIKNTFSGAEYIAIWGIEKQIYAGWCVRCIKESQHSKINDIDLLYYENLKNCEIIGNIHQNPELIK